MFFKPDHDVRQHVGIIDKHLTGSGRLDVLIRANDIDQFKDIDVFNDIRDRIKVIESNPLVKGINDISLPVGMIHQSFDDTDLLFPQTSDALEQELLFLEFSRGDNKTDVLSSVVDFDYKNTRFGNYHRAINNVQN